MVTPQDPLPVFRPPHHWANTPISTYLQYSTLPAPPVAYPAPIGTRWSGNTNFGGFTTCDQNAGPQSLAYHTIYDQTARTILTGQTGNSAKDHYANTRYRNGKVY